MDEQKQQAAAEALRMLAQKRMGHIAWARSELQRLRSRAKLAAEEIHKGTKDLDDPEISRMNNKKQAEEKMKNCINAALKEIEEMGLADELEKKAKQEREMLKEFKKKAKQEEEKMRRRCCPRKKMRRRKARGGG